MTPFLALVGIGRRPSCRLVGGGRIKMLLDREKTRQFCQYVVGADLSYHVNRARALSLLVNAMRAGGDGVAPIDVPLRDFLFLKEALSAKKWGDNSEEARLRFQVQICEIVDVVEALPPAPPLAASATPLGLHGSP